MTDKEHLRKMERALAEDWRKIKSIIEDYEDKSEADIQEEVGELRVDMILQDGDSLKDFIS